MNITHALVVYRLEIISKINKTQYNFTSVHRKEIYRLLRESTQIMFLKLRFGWLYQWLDIFKMIYGINTVSPLTFPYIDSNKKQK